MPETVQHLTKLIQIAILAAIAYVLTLFAIPIVPMAPYLKLDLSDLPILVGTVTLGIGPGMAIAALTLALDILMTGLALPLLIGDGLWFLSSLTTLLTVGLLFRWVRRRASWRRWITLITVMTLTLTVVMSIANSGAVPLYLRTLGMTIRFPVLQVVVYGIGPFNLIKGVVIGGTFTFLCRILRRSRYFKL